MLLLESCGTRVEETSGTPGKDGENCYSETRSTGNYIICGDSEFKVEDGKDGEDGANGIDGQDGRDGVDGQDGKDGVDGRDGVDGQDGIDGQDGEDGSFNGYLEFVQVCPQIRGSHIETLILLNGQYMAFLASGSYKKERLVILNENSLYKTTDGRNVKFTIRNGSIDCSLNNRSNDEDDD